MRVLIIATEFPPGPGGIGRHAFHVASGLSRLGWNVAVVAPQAYAERDEVAAFSEKVPYRVHSLPYSNSRLGTAMRRYSMLRSVLKYGWDVVIASGLRAVLAQAVVGRQIPWIAVAHGSEMGERNRALRPLTRHAFASADAVVFVSRYTQRLMHAAGIRARQERVITNGGDQERFRPIRESAWRPFAKTIEIDGAPTLLTVGNITERKGQDIVVSALPTISREVRNVRYVMVGLPTRRAAIEAQAHGLGVHDHIRFVGPLSDDTLPYAYNACDVFVMTSRAVGGDVEGYGIAAVEAALCAKPSVVTADSGLEEVVINGETGLIVPPDPGMVAEAICRLLEDDPLRRRLGENGRRRALHEQTWDGAARRFEHLVREIVGATAQRRHHLRSGKAHR